MYLEELKQKEERMLQTFSQVSPIKIYEPKIYLDTKKTTFKFL